MTTLQWFMLVTLPVTGMCYAILGSLKLALAERLQMDESRVAGLVSAFGFSVGPIILVSGFLADALGRRGVITGGALLVAASLFVLAWSRSYRLSVLAVGMLSGGWAMMINVANALMFMAYAKVFVATNLLDFLFGLGAFLTPPLIILLLRKARFSWAVALIGLLPLGAALFAPFVPMEVPGGAVQAAGFGALMRDPVMWLCALTLLLWIPIESCTAAWATTFVSNLAPAGEAAERSRRIAAWTLSGFWLCFMGSRLLTALLIHSGGEVSAVESMRQARLTHVLLAVACTGILLGLILSRSRKLTIGLLLGAGFLYGPFFPNLMGILLSHFPASAHGRAVGVLFAAGSIGWTVFPALIGRRATRGTIQRGFQIALATSMALLVLVVGHYLQAAPAASAAGGDGFRPLFNGRDLAGWVYGRTPEGDRRIGRGYQVAGGEVSCTEADCGVLYTDREYSDFVLRLEFRLARDSNNGIAVRAPLEGDPWKAGLEIQVIDEDGPKYRDIKPWQRHGSVYGVLPARPGHLRAPGAWNDQEITLRGSRVTVKLNGAVIVDGDLAEVKDPEVLGRHPGVRNRRGRIGLVGQIPGPVAYRNLRIKEL